jgi:hypothetical protein
VALSWLVIYQPRPEKDKYRPTDQQGEGGQRADPLADHRPPAQLRFGRRIIRMVILESLLLCLIAALLGTLLGVLATRALVLVPAVGSFLDPQYSPEVFVRALLVGVVVALAGAAYPAFRAVRLTPMEALRHE